MTRPTYLFRMFPDELARLSALASRFGGKREALSAALRALEREEAERQAESMETKSSVLGRLTALEDRVGQLEQGQRGPAGRSKPTRAR